VPARIEYSRGETGLLTVVRLDSIPKLAGAILDAAESVIMILDREGRLLGLNRSARVLISLSEKDDIVGRTLWDFIPAGEDVQLLRAGFDLLVAGEAPLRTEGPWKMKDGSTLILCWSHNLARDSAGKVEHVISTALDVTAVRHAEGALESISGEFMEAQTEQRRNISRYLHDTVSQDLVVLALSLGKLQRADRPEGSDLTQALSRVDRCCRDLRVLSYALAPPVFDDIGLASALDWYARHLREDAGISVEFLSDAVPETVPQGVRRLMFQIVQEWAETAIRNPGAGRTVISLNEANPGVVLKFACDRASDAAVTGLLASRVIRERVRILNGRFETLQDEGVSATIWIPMARARG
jgi:PAS domain S-box-containing protein